MKQKSIYGLTILMSLSLLGIVIAQYLWVKQAISVQEEKFNTSVFESLNNTVVRLHREQSANYMMNRVLPRINQMSKTASSKTGNRVVFKSQSKMANANNEPSNLDSLSKDNGSRQIQTHIQINNGNVGHQIWITGNNQQVQIVDKSYTNQDSITRVLNMAKQNEQELMRMFNQMSYEMVTAKDPLKSRLNLSNLEKVIQNEFERRSINTNFEYGVYDRGAQKLSKFKSDKFELAQLKDHNPVKIQLFQNDVFLGASPYELVVYFPHFKSYLLRTQGWLLFVSLFFTVFILVTFYLTMRMIINQKKVSQIKNDFINNMTHEFKTPLATISLATDSVMTPSVLSNETQARTFLNIIKEENARMNTHVERVLQMSLIDKSEFSVIVSPLDVHEIIDKAVANIQLLAEETGAEVVRHLNAQVTVLNLDEVHFTNVIINLLENALKYAKENPQVIISTANHAQGMTISIKDNGIGMTKDQQNKVFDKFYRAEGGNIHNVKGFGLGLSYVKAVIDAHQANISVKSKMGIGTEFIIDLPFNTNQELNNN